MEYLFSKHWYLVWIANAGASLHWMLDAADTLLGLAGSVLVVVIGVLTALIKYRELKDKKG